MFKYLFLTLLCILPSTAFSVDTFTEYFDYEASFIPQNADKITLILAEGITQGSKKSISNFDQYHLLLQQQLSSTSDKAVLKFVIGMNLRNKLTALDQQMLLGAKNINPLIQKTIEDMQSAFNEAMQLDSIERAKFTPKMYSFMKHNLTQGERITALQKELSLGGSGDNETQYWFTHWDVIGSLQDEGRYNEAEQALNTMQKELATAGLNKSDFGQIYQQAKSNLEKDHVLNDNTISASNSKPEPPKENPISALFENIQDKIKSYWLMILLNIFIVISLVIAYIKREKD